MSRTSKEILERLGSDGLSRVLDDLLDQKRLIRLANTCALKYPGMRTQSQRRQRILADLVRDAAEREATRKAILRVLDKETRGLHQAWGALTDQAQRTRLADDRFLGSNGNLARHLVLLARLNGDAAGDGLKQLLGRVQPPATAGTSRTADSAPAGGEAKLAKRVVQLQKKIQHLEGQLLKARETERGAKRDLIKRKGELAESRMLVERLQTQLKAARAASVEAKGSPIDPDTIESLTKAVRKLSSQQRKLVHGVEKLAVQESAPPAPVDLAPLVRSVRELQKRQAETSGERDRLLSEQSRRMDELRREVRSLKSRSKVTNRARARGEAARVGVFIDVQNMYYAARRLKGKLDFDALLQAAVADRRLIQATAYVVESKEIDQSGFIALLQQRGIEVRRKTLRVRADGSMKGDWDMELALDILDAAPTLDVVVLVSGDGDFTSLVKRVKRIGPRVEVIAFPRNTAKALLEAADSFQPLDRKLMIYPERSKRSQAPAAAEVKSPAATRASGASHG